MTGTNHFVSIDSALDYYVPYGCGLRDIILKINSKEIVIGPPEGKTFISEGRYFLTN